MNGPRSKNVLIAATLSCHWDLGDANRQLVPVHESAQMTKKKKPHERLSTFLSQLDKDLISTLTGESDRGCVLVSAGFIEEGLEHFLRKHLFTIATRQDDAEWLLSSGGSMAPIGSFHAKIVACSAIGLIDSGLRDAMMELKNLRNSFAHRDADSPNPSLTEENGLSIFRKLVYTIYD